MLSNSGRLKNFSSFAGVSTGEIFGQTMSELRVSGHCIRYNPGKSESVFQKIFRRYSNLRLDYFINNSLHTSDSALEYALNLIKQR